MPQFVHLHLHTEYSLLDGACRLAPLMEQVRAMGQSAVAITDHGVLYGAISFYLAAKAVGIHPIIGCEIYVAPRTRLDKDPVQDRRPSHLILLCENAQGYHNLLQIVSHSQLEGFYGKPRADWELLEQYHEGLIALSGCTRGAVAAQLLAGNDAAAKQLALRYAALFGNKHYYLEMQNHGLAEDMRVCSGLQRISAETGIPLVATNDVHYLRREDAALQKLLVCISTGTTLSAPAAMTMPNDSFYLKSAEEMEQLFPNAPQALQNTVEIAQRCQFEPEFGKLQLPRFSMEGVTDSTAYFRRLCEEGLHTRFGEKPPLEARERMEYEYDVIVRMGFVDYFLIVRDFVQYAKKNDIPVGPGRGSGAGSICAYLIGITEIDPLRFGLLFERFLNPERVSMPDFDIDFCIVGRQRVIDYVTRRYGRENVAQIVAFDTLKARAAIRDTGRAMEQAQLADRISRMLPPDQSITIPAALQSIPELQQLVKTNPQAAQLLQYAVQLEGMPRHTSIHAAGVVISPVPVSERVPLQRGEDGGMVTQYTMGILEKLGMLKMDFLGLRNLTVIREAERAIQRKDPDFSMRKIPEDDSAVYEMLSKGDSRGVFQLESEGVRKLLIQLRPQNMLDIAMVLALYRPGPMDTIPQYLAARKNPKRIRYDHPLLEPILRETYGVIVFQEQVMEICRTLAGFSLGRADLVRRAMAKKKLSEMEKERNAFIFGDDSCCGAIARGVSEEIANAIFDRMTAFASYAFNKSHAAAYARIVYETAYLKCRRPKEYLAALMTSVSASTGKLMEYISLSEASGIPVLRPDINRSEVGFTAEENGIRFGLSAVRGLGAAVISSYLTQRRTNGPYHSFREFCERNAGNDLNKHNVESLICAGVLDGLGWNRRQMLTMHETIIQAVNQESKKAVTGQLSLFNMVDAEEQSAVSLSPPNVPEYPEQILLQMEKETTGMYLSGHPLAKYRTRQRLLRQPDISSLADMRDGAPVKLICLISEARQHLTKKAEKMCYLTVEDYTGSVDCLVFPKLYSRVEGLLQEDRVVWILGKLSKEEGTLRVFCEEILPQEAFVQYCTTKQLCCKVQDGDSKTLYAVTALCRKYPGETPICFWLTQSRRYVKPREECRVRMEDAFLKELTAILPFEQYALIDWKG